MKPPWQMRPQQQQHSQHHQPSSNESFRSLNPNDVIQQQQQQLALSQQIYAQQQLNAMQQHNPVSFNFDHSIPHGIPSRPNIMPSFQANQSTFPPRRILPSMRVSLLRDIGIAGERDKDSPQNTSMESNPSLHPNELHQSGVQQLMFNQAAERQITMLGNLHHSGYRQHMQSTAPKELQTATIPELRSSASNLAQHSFGPSHTSQPISHTTAVQNPSKTDNVLTVVEQKSKEHLVQAMDKVDREMSKLETEIEKLEKKKSVLDKTANQPHEAEKSGSSPQRVEPKHRDLWQVIYAENRKKADDSATTLDLLCPVYDMPLYNQPSDTQVYQDNLIKNEEMRPKLLKFFKNKRKLENIRERYLCTRYNQLMEEWQKKVEEIESCPKYKAKEAKSREFFEKLFPEVKKQREQNERVDRVGTRGDLCRSDADFNDIVVGLSEQDNQLQHMRHLAVVPPMLLDQEERRIKFISNNGFISEPFKEYKQVQLLDAWAESEKEIFKEKYIQHPKNFNVISSFIEKKSVEDCILFYYLTKKKVNYKSLVRKNTMKPRKLKSGRVHASQAHDQSNTKDSDKINKEDGRKYDDDNNEIKIDKPPSPRMTRARKQTMNWSEEEISLVKDGFSKYGRDFSSIARIVKNKSEQQVRNFYHNYKKKHGLDQLIAEYKTKKGGESRRSRHHQPSPDTSNINEEAETNIEDKQKKQDDNVAEDKKKSSERTTTSPATTKPSTENETSINTSHIRTRRTTAALAAAASNEDPVSSKKSTNTTQTTNIGGEPAEKKHKKNDQKSRYQKYQESNEILTVETKKNEPLKIVVKTESKSDKNVVKENIPVTQPPKEVPQKSETISKVIEKVISTSATEVLEKPKIETKISTPTTKDTDHDSSATCSADEETTEILPDKRHTDSPYAFDDNLNDSQTRIRLESVRHSAATTTSTAETPATKIVTQPVNQNTVLNLTMKPSNIDRPQSLPPSTLYPYNVTSPDIIHTKTIRSAFTSAIDELSRPSSTPAFANIPTSIPINFPVPNKKEEPRKEARPKEVEHSEVSIFPVSSLRFTTTRDPPKTVKSTTENIGIQKTLPLGSTTKTPVKDHLKPLPMVQSSPDLLRYHLQSPNTIYHLDGRFQQRPDEKLQTSVPAAKFPTSGLSFAVPGSIIQGKPVFRPQLPIDPSLFEHSKLTSSKSEKDLTRYQNPPVNMVTKYPRFPYPGVTSIPEMRHHLTTITPPLNHQKPEKERSISLEEPNKIEPHKLPQSSHSNLGSIVNGTPIKSKNPSLQHQPGMQAVVMSSMLQDRRPTKLGNIVREALPHHSSPLLSYNMEKAIKQERRSSSSSNISEKSHQDIASASGSSMRPQQSLHQQQQKQQQKQPQKQPQQKQKPEYMSEPNLHEKFPPGLTSIADPHLLASLSLANIPNLPYNLIQADQQQLTHNIMSQYLSNLQYPNPALFPGIYPGLLRPYSPSGNDNIDNSRHNVLTQDFATAQLMQQKNTSQLPGLNARTSPFPLVPHSIPSSHHITPISTPSITSHSNMPTPLARSHASSPASLDRLNFIPQHSSVIFNPNTSPVRVSSVDYKNLSSPVKIPSHHPPTDPHKPPQSVYMTPHHQAMLVQQLQQQQAGAFPGLIKQEGQILDEGLKSNLQGYGLGHIAKSQDREITQEMLAKEQLRNYGLMAAGMRPKIPQQQQQYNRKEQEELKTLKQQTQQQTGRMAKDLKKKGRVTMTPFDLINAVIDHNIAANYMDKQENVDSKAQSTSNIKENEIISSRPFIPEKQPVQTKNLTEHSHDIISNMYRTKEIPKAAPFQLPEHKIPQKYEPKPESLPAPIVIEGQSYSRPESSDLSPKLLMNPMDIKQHEQIAVSSRATNVVQHPFVPMMNKNGQSTLDLLIRQALLDKEVSPNPVEDHRHPIRPGSATNRQSPVIQQLQPHYQPVHQQLHQPQHHPLHQPPQQQPPHQPSHQPAHQQPPHQQPIHQQPPHQQQPHQQPAHQQQPHQQPAHHQPPQQQPPQQQPIHQQSAHQQSPHQPLHQPPHQLSHQQPPHQQTHQQQPPHQPPHQQQRQQPIQQPHHQPTPQPYKPPNRDPKPFPQQYTSELARAPPPTTQPPAMFSALSFRSGGAQSSNSPQMHLSPNVTPRPSVVSNPSNTRLISSAGTFHPQSPISPSLPSTQYEPLSDSD